MMLEAIRHTGCYPDIYPDSRNSLVVTLRTAKHDASNCSIIYFARTTASQKKCKALKLVYRDDLFDYWRTRIQFHQIARYQKYFFQIQSDEVLYFTSEGFSREEPSDGFFEYLYANTTDTVTVPSWAKGQIFYQIFPERFSDGDSSNNPENTEPWGSEPTRDNFMGGDLKGILNHLDDLQKLGINCLYLNPIFKADFNHKYATTDYFSIDPQFGTSNDLQDLIQAVHNCGMKIILDGVFNHCGIHFKPFQDVMKNQEKSVYKDWFLIKKFPFDITHHAYECVGAYKYMPKLNTGNPEVRSFILNVMDYWIREYHIDGWRLDVADEVDEGVWEEARLILKSRYPQILLLGETWGPGYQLMNGTQMDAIMNYVFRKAVLDFIALNKISAYEFNARLERMLASYPEEMNQAMFTPLDSHDTERFLTSCGNDVRKMKMAAAFQMTFPGSPSVYYGDEIGLDGQNDPGCRKCMIWQKDQWNQELYDWYLKLISLRQQAEELRTGSYLSVYCSKDVYAFLRSSNKRSTVTVLNNSDHDVQIDVPVVYQGEYRNLMSGEMVQSDENLHSEAWNNDMADYKGCLRIRLKAYETAILRENKTNE